MLHYTTVHHVIPLPSQVIAPGALRQSVEATESEVLDEKTYKRKIRNKRKTEQQQKKRKTQSNETTERYKNKNEDDKNQNKRNTTKAIKQQEHELIVNNIVHIKVKANKPNIPEHKPRNIK